MNVAARRRGLTIIEVLVIVVVGFVSIVVLIQLLTPQRCGSRQLKDSTQVRGVVQAMSIWACNNNDNFPRPSLFDLNNTTVPELGAAKDTTANLFSILINNGSISPELLISPAEANGQITQYENYEFNTPHAAVDPSKALWDPAFSVDFTNGHIGHASYAHAYPWRAGGGKGKWGGVANGSATDAILGNRGPQVSSVSYDKSGAAEPVFKLGRESVTNLIHGGRSTWEGNIAFADGHVDFLTSTISGRYPLLDARASGTTTVTREDVLFYDEPDAAEGKNNFLGIFIKAGEQRSDFQSIWD